MLNSKKMILGLAIVAALLGSVIGGVAMKTSSAAEENKAMLSTNAEMPINAETLSSETQAYRAGFNDGLQAVQDNGATVVRSRSRARVAGYSDSQSNSRSTQSYNQPRQRTFWQKHRDKLTVAMGTGGGAVLGGLIGGKKGALIGAGAGGGGSALYTYKLRKRGARN